MKRLWKQCAALVLVLSLLTPALAISGETAFPNQFEQYPGFADVSSANWFFSAVQTCYQTGLMNGKGDFFDPDGILTLGEVAAIAARMNEAITGQLIVLGTPLPGETLPWYHWHVEYLRALDIPLPGDPTAPATRRQFLQLLNAVLPQELLAPVNTVSTLPDSTDPDVLRFYNAGILTGVDKWGSFAPEKTLTRAEVAAMVSRVAREALRQTFTPADYTPFTAAGCTPGDVFFQGAGQTVTAGAYLPYVLELIGQLEDACLQQGISFNWFHTYGEQTFLTYVVEESLTHFGMTKAMGTDLYRNFDVQVFYSKVLDLQKTPAVL